MLTYQEKEYLKPIHRLLLNIAFLSVISFCVPDGWFILFQYILLLCSAALSRNNEYFGRKKMNLKVLESKLAQPLSEL